jgi:hypothetical protein
MTFDLYGVSKIVEQGFARKLELVENALVKLDSSFESLSITETFAFVASPQAGKLYRFNYQISEDVVQFTKPVAFDIDTSRDTLDEQTQKVVRNIVDALAENDETQVDLYRAQWMALERQKYQLEHALNLNVGIKTEKIQKTREFVKEAIESTRGGRSVMRKGVQTTLFTELIENKEIQITPTTPNINVEPISRQRLIYQQIVDGRFAAKELVESPVFAEYAKESGTLLPFVV